MQPQQLKAILSQLLLKLANFKLELETLNLNFDSFNSKFIVLQARKEEIISKSNPSSKYQVTDLFLYELNQIDNKIDRIGKVLNEYIFKIREIKFKIDSTEKCFNSFKAKLKLLKKLKNRSLELFASEEVESIVTVLGLLYQSELKIPDWSPRRD